MTMTLVSTVTVGAGGAASIDFTSIPQTGTDLLIVLSMRSNNAAVTDRIGYAFNAATVTQSNKYLLGDGSGAYSGGYSNYPMFMRGNGASATANTFDNATMYIPNYAGSQQKSISVDSVTENNATSAEQMLLAGLWQNTSAITSIAITPMFGTAFVQYSTVSLYIITKGSGGATVA